MYSCVKYYAGFNGKLLENNFKAKPWDSGLAYQGRNILIL